MEKTYLKSKDLTKAKRELFNRGKVLSKQITKTRIHLEELKETKRLVTVPLMMHMDTHDLDGIRQGKTLAYITRSTTPPSFKCVMAQVDKRIPAKYKKILNNAYEFLFDNGTPYLAYRTNGKAVT